MLSLQSEITKNGRIGQEKYFSMLVPGDSFKPNIHRPLTSPVIFLSFHKV